LNQANSDIENEITYFKNKITKLSKNSKENQDSLDLWRRNLNHLLGLTINSELEPTKYEETMEFLKNNYKYLQDKLAIK
jgi:prefoldin subunit 5